VVLSLLKVTNGNFLAATRLLYAMEGRDFLGRRLGSVHPDFQTPAAAILLVGLFGSLVTLLGRSILVPITEVGSFTCAIGWLASCLAFCCGAGGKLTGLDWVLGSIGTLVAALFIGIVALGFGHYEWLALAAWAALGMMLWFAQRRRRGR